jgi:hypothetical protein
MQKGQSKMKPLNQIERIKKAIKLIESGAVTPMTEGRYSVRTERMNIQYTVTITSCDGFDFTETLKGESPCKHMWAAIGATAAVRISEIHTASSVAELDRVGLKYADAMKGLHESFVKIARSEYKARHNALRVTPLAEILVKPQPTSNRRYCGIEI